MLMAESFGGHLPPSSGQAPLCKHQLPWLKNRIFWLKSYCAAESFHASQKWQ